VIEPEIEASLKVYPTENPGGTVEPVVGVIAANAGEFASIVFFTSKPDPAALVFTAESVSSTPLI